MAFCKTGKLHKIKLTACSFAFLSLTTVSGLSFFAPAAVMAQEARQEGAKGLFFEQLEKPAENLNTGLRYWIEMKRNGNMQRVSNKTQFRSGDSIRFHIRSNITGYAYILLSSGSRGEQSVLFPDEKAGEKNKIERGREYVLPGDGALTFDENPGTEKLTLLLSRTPIDAQAYLAKPAGEKELTLIASNETGSKDLVPARIYVAYSAPHTDGPPPILLAAANRSTAAEKTYKTIKTDKVTKVAKKTDSHAIKNEKAAGASTASVSSPATASNAFSSASSSSLSSASSKRPGIRRTTIAAANSASNAKEDEGTTTVVSEKSSGVLHVDVDLEHI